MITSANIEMVISTYTTPTMHLLLRPSCLFDFISGKVYISNMQFLYVSCIPSAHSLKTAFVWRHLGMYEHCDIIPNVYDS